MPATHRIRDRLAGETDFLQQQRAAAVFHEAIAEANAVDGAPCLREERGAFEHRAAESAGKLVILDSDQQ